MNGHRRKDLEAKLSGYLQSLKIPHHFERPVAGRHPRIVVHINGRDRFYIYPATYSDPRSPLNSLAGLKRFIRQLMDAELV